MHTFPLLSVLISKLAKWDQVRLVIFVYVLTILVGLFLSIAIDFTTSFFVSG